jgi:hypothetical protein
LHSNVISKHFILCVGSFSDTESSQSRNSNDRIGKKKNKTSQKLRWKREAVNGRDGELCEMQSVNNITKLLQFSLSRACFGGDISMVRPT